MGKLDKLAFKNALDKLTKQKLFLSVEDIDHTEIFTHYVEHSETCKFTYNDGTLIVWEERIPIIANVLDPKPSSPLIKILENVEGHSLILSDINYHSIAKSLYICTLLKKEDITDLINFKSLTNNTNLIISSFKMNYLLCISLPTFINYDF